MIHLRLGLFLKYTNLDSPPFLRRHCIENDEEVGGEGGVESSSFGSK